MRKLFKKALACCLVAALALTCFVGALSVSAETYTGTLNVATIEVAADATEAIVPVTIESANALNAAKITVAASEGWEVSAIAIDAASTAAKIEADNINGDTFIVEAVDNIAGFTTATVNVTFTSKAAVAATITATLDPVHAATWNEDVVNLAVTDGAITVKAAVVEPELDEKLGFYIKGANIQDTLGVACTIKKADYSYASYKVEFTATKYDESRDTYVAEPVIIDAAAVGTAYARALYPNIALYELDQLIVAVIKAYDAEGNYVAYSKEIELSPAELLKEVYNKASSPAKTKTLVVDMLNLGTEAQAYFGKTAATSNPDNDLLANYNNAPINKGWENNEYASTTTKEDIVSKLALIEGTGITWAADSPLTSSNITFTASLNMAATPTLSYRITDSKVAYSENDFKVEISYDAVYPSALAGKKEQISTGSDWSLVGSGKYKMVPFVGMTLADSNQTVTAKLYYQDKLVLTSEYTMDQGIKNLLTNANSGALALALGRFEIAARAYFA